MNMILTFRLLVAALVLTGCARSQSVFIRSSIDSSLYDHIRELDADRYEIKITSGGGLSYPAIKLGVYLLDKKVHLKVQDYCLSACAEFLLPAADEIRFVDNPVVGFHWSPLMTYHQYVRVGAELSACTFPTGDQLTLLNARHLNTEFWRETEKRLKLKHFETIMNGERCPMKIREFENRFWLPTSDQLRNIWGLKFTGSVCADDFVRCMDKVNRIWARGTRIVIGDRVYVSAGRKRRMKRECQKVKQSVKDFKDKYEKDLSEKTLEKIMPRLQAYRDSVCAPSRNPSDIMRPQGDIVIPEEIIKRPSKPDTIP